MMPNKELVKVFAEPIGNIVQLNIRLEIFIKQEVDKILRVTPYNINGVLAIILQYTEQLKEDGNEQD